MFGWAQRRIMVWWHGRCGARAWSFDRELKIEFVCIKPSGHHGAHLGQGVLKASRGLRYGWPRGGHR